MIRTLTRIGIIRIKEDGSIRWPISIYPWHLWTYFFWHGPRVQVFRNLPQFIKWERGRLLPRRWGFAIIGLEIGDRG